MDFTKELELGHPDLDEQHRELNGLHALAAAAVRAGEAPAVRGSLGKLAELTRRHFAFEERLMAEAAYPDRESHAAGHAAFLKDLDLLEAHAAKAPCSPLVRLWLESRYASWWLLHLRSHDARLVSRLSASALLPGAGYFPRGGKPAGLAPRMTDRGRVGHHPGC